MKKSLFLLLFFSSFIFAQNQRFIYEYQYIPDSTNLEDVKKDMMVLDIEKDGSKYYSYDKFVSDSITKVEVEKQIQAGSGNINIQRKENPNVISYSVTKDYPDFNVFLHERISMDNYKIAEDEKPEWTILSDHEKTGSYDAQKATTSFGGRQWTAWFSTDLPFPDGPYKFYGLPGLIVKIGDTTGSHKITLVANKSSEAAMDTTLEMPNGGFSVGFNTKEIEVTEKQFAKAWKSYINDPSKNLREIMMKNSAENKVVLKMKGADGKEISDPNEIYRNMEKRVKEQLEKNNNRIEPDLYQ